MANSSITAAQGFEAAGISCGIKQSGHLDLGLIFCPTGAKAAAVLTTNRITSAAVEVCRDHAGGPRRVKAVVANSGNANACTGRSGRRDALAMCRETALHLGGQAEEVLPASTGIIGKPLPMSQVRQGIGVAARALSHSAQAGLQFARAIMTTDTRPKQAVRRFRASGRDITVAGTIKGAGMIGPNMATTLCFLTTDMARHQSLLGRALRTAVGASLNKLTVDGHQSTNDTAILLASGLAGNRP
ncbi:MAG: bifunctional ornithine acetyltransferase/N-acetylglutamate synthase, partial [Planctomycetes bacterium]|nr:bifunctional ornithine acetyltransferase/N-acetylglutamate synthase [Planctomycetota bacterium]